MGRAPCCDKNGLKKGPWTPEEDQKLIDYIHKHGCGIWRTLPKNAGLQRCGKSCRLRWTNYLRPDIKRGKFSFEEEETIIQLHSILGNKWSAIAARLPGRTDNEIKNYWNTHIRKRLLRMGIDPVTHAFRLDLMDLSTLLLNPSLYCNSNSPSEFKISNTLLEMQHLISNPELTRLASSLFSSHHQNQDFLIQNQQNIVNDNSLLQSTCQMQIPYQEHTTPIPFSGHDHQAHQFMHYNRVQDLPAENLDGFGIGSQSDGSQLTEEYILATNYGYYGSSQPVVDAAPSSETSPFQSDSSNNFSFQSVFSNVLQADFDLYDVNSSS